MGISSQIGEPMKQKYIARIVNLEPQDYRTVRRLANEKGLGGKGFSAALRMIIREWSALQRPVYDATPPADPDA